MDILAMKEQVLNLREELNTIISNGEKEVRELNDQENSRIAEIRSEIDKLEADITAEEKRNIEIKNNENKNTNKTMNVRLFDLVKGVVEGNLTDEQRQFVNGSKINLRSTIQAQGEAGTGIENVPQDEKSLEVAIRNASVLSKLNCAYFSNAVGDIQIPKYSGSQVSWAGETDTASDGAGEFSEVILQPKRLTAVVKISKTFLAQDRNSAEAVLISDLAKAVAEKLDQTIFGAASGTTNRPEGLFYNSGYTTTGETLSAITYNDVLDLELKVEEANGNDYVFITSPNVKQALRGVQMASGLDMVYSHNELDGIKTIVSNSVKKGGILALVPEDLAVASWSGVEITVDPYTEVANNCIRLVVNAYYDAKMKGDRIAGVIFE